MKIGQRSRPRMPTTDGGHSRACVNRCRSRVRSRDASATARPSAPFRPPLPERCFRSRSGFRLARSPSPPIVTLRAFHAKRRPALLWIRLPPIDFCNCNDFLPMRGHAHEHPILTEYPEVRTLADPQAHSRFRSRFTDLGLPLSKKPTRACKPRQPFRRRPHGAASTPHDTPPETTARPRRRLRATPKPNHRLRRRLSDDSAGLHGPRDLERRTFLSRRLLPQVV